MVVQNFNSTRGVTMERVSYKARSEFLAKKLKEARKAWKKLDMAIQAAGHYADQTLLNLSGEVELGLETRGRRVCKQPRKVSSRRRRG